MKVIKDKIAYIKVGNQFWHFDTIVVTESNMDLVKHAELFNKLLGKLSNESSLLAYTVGSEKFSFEISLTSSSKHDKIVCISIFDGSKRQTYFLFNRKNRRDLTNSELGSVLVANA